MRGYIAYWFPSSHEAIDRVDALLQSVETDKKADVLLTPVIDHSQRRAGRLPVLIFFSVKF